MHSHSCTPRLLLTDLQRHGLGTCRSVQRTRHCTHHRDQARDYWRYASYIEVAPYSTDKASRFSRTLRALHPRCCHRASLSGRSGVPRRRVQLPGLRGDPHHVPPPLFLRGDRRFAARAGVHPELVPQRTAHWPRLQSGGERADPLPRRRRRGESACRRMRRCLRE